MFNLSLFLLPSQRNGVKHLIKRLKKRQDKSEKPIELVDIYVTQNHGVNC